MFPIPLPSLSTILKIAPWALAALAIVFGVWERGTAAHEATALAEFQAKTAKAVAAQKIADAAESQKLLDEQARQLADLHSQVAKSLQEIHNAPVTHSCGPVVHDAARSVRGILAGPGR